MITTSLSADCKLSIHRDNLNCLTNSIEISENEDNIFELYEHCSQDQNLYITCHTLIIMIGLLVLSHYSLKVFRNNIEKHNNVSTQFPLLLLAVVCLLTGLNSTQRKTCNLCGAGHYAQKIVKKI